jgi:glucan phosphoethanolaminetransferase (alkaline phosphatase superfamily)
MNVHPAYPRMAYFCSNKGVLIFVILEAFSWVVLAFRAAQLTTIKLILQEFATIVIQTASIVMDPVATVVFNALTLTMFLTKSVIKIVPIISLGNYNL